MMALKQTMLTAVLFAGVAVLSSCGVRSVLNDSGIDSKRDAQGNVILLDTPRMWDEFRMLTNISIKYEVEGNTHWGKSKSANEEWVRVIRYNEVHREHPQKYIEYIIEQRRKAGLPELVGYP